MSLENYKTNIPVKRPVKSRANGEIVGYVTISLKDMDFLTKIAGKYVGEYYLGITEEEKYLLLNGTEGEITKIGYYEVFFDDHLTSICIKANREPTKEEATAFCMKDIKTMGFTQVTEILELTKEDAYRFYDMSNEENLPIFGEED